MTTISELTTHLTGLTQEEMCVECPTRDACGIAEGVAAKSTNPIKTVLYGVLNSIVNNIEVLMPGVTYQGLYRARELGGPDMMRVSLMALPPILTMRHGAPTELLAPSPSVLRKFAFSAEEVRKSMHDVHRLLSVGMEPGLAALPSMVITRGGRDAEAMKMALAPLAMAVYGSDFSDRDLGVIAAVDKAVEKFPMKRLRTLTHMAAVHPMTNTQYICLVDEWIGNSVMLLGYSSGEEKLVTFVCAEEHLLPFTEEGFHRLRGTEWDLDDITNVVNQMTRD